MLRLDKEKSAALRLEDAAGDLFLVRVPGDVSAPPSEPSHVQMDVTALSGVKIHLDKPTDLEARVRNRYASFRIFSLIFLQNEDVALHINVADAVWPGCTRVRA